MPSSGSAIAPQGVSLRAAKLALRTSVLDLRSRLAPATRDVASRTIAASIAERPDFRAASCVCLPLPFGSEWDARLLAELALASHKALAVPRVDGEARMLELYGVRSLELDVEPGYQGIPEPRRHCAPVRADSVDWVLVPLVAFDRRGRRLGYGGGYYDRFLPLLREGVPRVAGAFDLQQAEHVPAAPHDITVDFIVTETTTWETSACAARSGDERS